jgi:hypothetical protein
MSGWLPAVFLPEQIQNPRAEQAAEKVPSKPSGVKTPEETKTFMSRLKPRPTDNSAFFRSL